MLTTHYTLAEERNCLYLTHLPPHYYPIAYSKESEVREELDITNALTLSQREILLTSSPLLHSYSIHRVLIAIDQFSYISMQLHITKT